MSAISWKTKVEMIEIQESEITVIENVIPSNLLAVPGTMKLHVFKNKGSRNMKCILYLLIKVTNNMMILLKCCTLK